MVVHFCMLISRKGGYIGLFFYPSHQWFMMAFPYSLVNNFWDFYRILIDWLIKLGVQTFPPLFVIYSSIILFIIIGNVHQFIGHFLIPLNLVKILLITKPMKFFITGRLHICPAFFSNIHYLTR